MLDSLCIKNFRCFEDLTIKSLGRVNLIVGKNNSGKTTLLEAISFFVDGREICRFNSCMLEIIENIRNLLGNRNEFFLYKETLSDLHTFSKILSINAENTNIFFSDINKIKVFNISLIKSTNSILFKVLNDKNESIHALDEKYNIVDHLKVSLEKEHGKPLPDLSKYSVGKAFEISDIPNPETPEFIPPSFLSVTIKSFLVPSSLVSENELGLLWDKVYQKNTDKEIIEQLKVVLPTISSLNFLAKEGTSNRAAFVKEEGYEEARPLKTMGEGVSRLLQIFLYAFLSRGGYLLIDEFENGLHYSIQEDIWQKLFKLADALDIQVFVTTHSKDVLESFAKVAKNETKTTANLISLGRSVAKSNRGQIISHVYKQEQLDWIIN
jgi:AAA15 family ATPase/GTPase